MKRIEHSDLFEIVIPSRQARQIPLHYQLHWQPKGEKASVRHTTLSPYSFAPQLGEMDLYLFGEGKHRKLWQVMGSHLTTIDEIAGVLFSVWAPGVIRVSVVGDFNNWNGLRHPMRNRGSSGVWELFIPGLHAEDAYKYEIRTTAGQLLLKTDPFAQRLGVRPETTTLVTPNRPTVGKIRDGSLSAHSGSGNIAR